MWSRQNKSQLKSRSISPSTDSLVPLASLLTSAAGRFPVLPAAEFLRADQHRLLELCRRADLCLLLLIAGHLRRDVANELQFRQRREFFNWHATDDHLGGLRIEHDLEAKLFELRDCFIRFLRQPDLN